MERVDSLEEIAVGDRLGALDEQVGAMADEELLVRVELALEEAQVAAVDGAAELDKVGQLILLEQRR